MVIAKYILALVLVFSLALFSLSLVSAELFSIKSVTPSLYINRSENTLINFTINSTGSLNITQVIIQFPMESTYVYGANGTNGTTASNVVFSNRTAPAGIPYIQLIWTNTSATSIIGANETKSFWFNVSLRRTGTNGFFNSFTIVTNDTGSRGNLTTYSYTINFAFAGFVKNETGAFQNASNFSLYQFVLGTNGPPTEIFEANVLSNANGSFLFPSINGSATSYLLKIIHYNSTGSATKVGSILPAFPAEMYYPASADIPEFAFMIPPSLNGTTFYLQPASTLRLYANNNSNQQKFGYMVIDQGVGFPLSSSIMSSVTTKEVIVPTARDYTVMFTRMPGFPGGSGFSFDPSCDGGFMNDTLCPSPPISNSTLGTLTAGQILVINQSLTITNQRLQGCLNVATGANNTAVNITSIVPKLMPWTGFVPPIKADRGDINLTVDLNYTGKGGCSFVYYNISVMGAAGGINYLVEFYAKNGTNEASNPGTSSWNLAAFQNVSIPNSIVNLNITLYRLTGSYNSTGASSTVNTSYIRINIQNSTGGAITNNLNANVKIKNPTTGTITYIIEGMTNGRFYIPILNNSNWAKIIVFANDAPPREISINLSASETNVTLVTMMEGKGIGMKRINATGEMQMINRTELDSVAPIGMKFIRNTESCTTFNPISDCVLTNTTAKGFNPLTALIAGKVNMEMKITSTNVTLTFMDYDMFAAKQPPLESIMNENATSTSSTQQQWNFGSFAPTDTYSYATIGMPYSDNSGNAGYFNDGVESINVTTPLLYDENWKVVWNISRGDTSANLTDEFLDYNSSSLYRNYLSSAGASCSKTDPFMNVTPCFINTTSNMIYMKVPHFSGIGPTLTAAATVAATTTTTSSGGSSGGAAPGSYWTTRATLSETQFTNGYTATIGTMDRIKFKVGTDSHEVGIVSVTTSSVTINVSSKPQQAVLNIGDIKKFDVTNDNYYDVQVKLNSIKNKVANLTINKINELIATQEPASSTTGEDTSIVPEFIPGAEKLSRKSSIIVVIIAVLVIIILIIAGIIFVLKRKNNKSFEKKFRAR